MHTLGRAEVFASSAKIKQGATVTLWARIGKPPREGFNDVVGPNLRFPQLPRTQSAHVNDVDHH